MHDIVRCPRCKARTFSTSMAKSKEEALEELRKEGRTIARMVHACGKCGAYCYFENGFFRVLTPAEEFHFRMIAPTLNTRAGERLLKNDMPHGSMILESGNRVVEYDPPQPHSPESN